MRLIKRIARWLAPSAFRYFEETINSYERWLTEEGKELKYRRREVAALRASNRDLQDALDRRNPEANHAIPQASILGETTFRNGTILHEALTYGAVNFPEAGLTVVPVKGEKAIRVLRGPNRSEMVRIEEHKLTMPPVKASGGATIHPTLTLP